MRGIFFQKPFEIVVEIQGERWRQGDSMGGKVTLRNRSTERVTPEGVSVALALGNLGKVKKKDPGAFEIIEERLFQGDLSALEPGAVAEMEFRFNPDWNAPITDFTSSPFLVCGGGALQLQFDVAPVCDELVQTLVTQHGFAFKGYKNGKKRGSGVEAKLTAPQGRTFATLDHLLLKMVFDSKSQDLETEFEFHVRKIEATAASFDVKKDKRQWTRKFKSGEYLTSSGRVNFEVLRNAAAEAVSRVEAKISY